MITLVKPTSVILVLLALHALHNGSQATQDEANAESHPVFVFFNQIFYVELKGTSANKELVLKNEDSGDTDWLTVIPNIANNDREVKDVKIDRQNVFMKFLDIECGEDIRFKCGEAWDGAHYFNEGDRPDDDGNSYNEMVAENDWAIRPTNHPGCGPNGDDVGDWCNSCMQRTPRCPDIHEMTLDCSYGASRDKCKAKKAGKAKYMCKSIPALINPGCDVLGCIGNNRKISTIRMYREPTCRVSDVRFKIASEAIPRVNKRQDGTDVGEEAQKIRRTNGSSSYSDDSMLAGRSN